MRGPTLSLAVVVSVVAGCRAGATNPQQASSQPTRDHAGGSRGCERLWGQTSTIPAAPFIDLDGHAHWTGERLLIWDARGRRAASLAPTHETWLSLDERFTGMRVHGVTDRYLLVASEGQFPKPLAGLIVDAHTGETRPFTAPTKVLLEPLTFADALLFSTDGWTAALSEAPLLFEPARDRWTEITGPLPERREQPTVVLGDAGFLLRWGGRSPTGVITNDGSVIDRRTRTRRLLPSGGPSPRTYPLTAAHGMRAAIWGGQDTAGSRRDGGVLDLDGDRWQPISELPGTHDDWRGLALTDTHLVVWDIGREVASFELASSSWRATTLPEGTWTLERRALQDEAGRLIFVDLEQLGVFDPRSGRWCTHALPNDARGRTDMINFWIELPNSSALLTWGGFSSSSSGGCDNHTGPEGCDPWVEHHGRSDGWLLHSRRR